MVRVPQFTGPQRNVKPTNMIHPVNRTKYQTRKYTCHGEALGKASQPNYAVSSWCGRHRSHPIIQTNSKPQYTLFMQQGIRPLG